MNIEAVVIEKLKLGLYDESKFKLFLII